MMLVAVADGEDNIYQTEDRLDNLSFSVKLDKMYIL